MSTDDDDNNNNTTPPIIISKNTRNAMASIAPILKDFTPKLSKNENIALKLHTHGTPDLDAMECEDVDTTLQRTFSVTSDSPPSNNIIINNKRRGSILSTTTDIPKQSTLNLNLPNSHIIDDETIFLNNNPSISSPLIDNNVTENNPFFLDSYINNSNENLIDNNNNITHLPKLLPKIGTIGVCAMDTKVLSKPMRRILNRLIENGEFETIIFGDKVILDENIENWPTCDFLISFFSNGFPLDKAIKYVNLRKPFLINSLIMQKVLWDRRLVLNLLESVNIPTPNRLEISRDGGPYIDPFLKDYLIKNNINIKKIIDNSKQPNWKMLDDDTLQVNDQIIKKPFVEKPVDGEDHNIYIYYHSKNGGGGRKLFRKIGNKSSEFDPNLNKPRLTGSYIYEKFMDADKFEDVKAYTVGENFCHAETRKSPVVDGIVKRNTFGKEVRYLTDLTDNEKEIAKKVSKIFEQMICGFDLLRVKGKSYVIDVNGFSFVKDNQHYYDKCTSILRDTFIKAKIQIDKQNRLLHVIQEEKKQKWVFKGLVTVIRHADRTPKQKIKHSFTSPIFISLLKGYKEEVVIRNVNDLGIVLQALKIAQEENAEDPIKLASLSNALEKKLEFPGTKIQLKPVLTKDNNEVEKVQFILKWGGEPTHSARYQARELGEQTRQDFDLLNRSILKNIKIFSSSERRVLLSAQILATALYRADELKSDEISIRRDLLDDSNAAKDLMDKVKKKLKPLLREGKNMSPQFAWPQKMPEPYLVMKRVVELMQYHKKLMDYKFTHCDVDSMQEKWCCSEDPSLFKERWEKLFTEFACLEKVDPSKISELYDTMKYDALHNRDFLEHIFDPSDLEEDVRNAFEELCPHYSLVDKYPINILAKNNFKIVEAIRNRNYDNKIKQPINSVGSLGWVLEKNSKTSEHANSVTSVFEKRKFMQFRELFKLAKVLFDFICPKEYGIEDSEKLDIGLLTSLPLAKQILKDISDMKDMEDPACHVYFTKESHIYTILNIIYESGLPMRVNRNALPEFDYLSQINFELYESTDSNGTKSHSIRLKMSPGCHTQDPLDVQLDEKHYISCIPKISLTRHLDLEYVSTQFKNQFKRVHLPQTFTPINITKPKLEYTVSTQSLGDDSKKMCL